MQLQIDKLGKVSITIEESYWDINKDYDKLTVVEKEGTFGTYISRKPVPAGSLLTDRTYWIPFSSLKEDIVLDYAEFTAKYGKELIAVKDHMSEIDEQIAILNKLNENTNEAISTANKAIDVATTAINSAKEALNEAENIIATNKKYTDKLDGVGNNVIINDNVYLGTSTKTEENSYVGKNAKIGQNVVVENKAFIGQSSIVEENVNIGENVNIMAETNIASKTYITDKGLFVGAQTDDNHIIGRDNNGNIFVGSDANGVDLTFYNDVYYPINILNSAGSSTGIKINKNASVVIGSEVHSTNASVVIGSGVNIDPNVKVLNETGNIKISTNTTDNIVLGNNSLLGADVKLYKSGNNLTYDGDKSYTIATTDSVDKRINDIVAGAPEAFDTLKEISDKLQDNDDVVAGIITTLGDKVDKTDITNVAYLDANYENCQLKHSTGSNVYPITKTTNIINPDNTRVVNNSATIKISTDINVYSFNDIFQHVSVGDIKIGSHVNIKANVTIQGGITIGSNVNISNTYIGQANIINANIGDSVTINNDVTIDSNVKIGNNVTIGTNVSISENTYIGGVLTIADKGALSIATKDGQAATYIGTNVSIGDSIGIGNKVYINDGVSIQKNIKLINILDGSDTSTVKGVRIKNDKAVINYELGTGFSIERRDESIKVIDIGEGFDAKKNVKLGSGAKLGDYAYIGTGIQFDIKNGNLVVTINDVTYGIVLNTLG